MQIRHMPFLLKFMCAVALYAEIASANLGAGEKMNVLFIPVDDLKPLLGCYGNTYVKTPNIDRLATRGTVFMNNACQQAVCGPSRASSMTGCYPDTTRVYDLKTKMRDKNPNILTIPQYFRQNGYETTGLGKTFDPRCVDDKLDAPSWSIPYRQYLPLPQSFGKKGGQFGHYRNPKTIEVWEKVTALMKKKGIKEETEKRKFASQYPDFRPPIECMDVPDNYYQDGMMTIEAIRTMKKLASAKEPFFLSVGYHKPHLPFIAPKKYWDLYKRSEVPLTDKPGMIPGIPQWVYNFGGELRGMYTGIPEGHLPEDKKRELIHGYLACVSYVDAQIGLLLDGLDKIGIADKTIIVLWGDHGWHLGDHEQWCKHTNFEEAARAPLIIASPNQKDKGKQSFSPVEFVDIFPTLCELNGLEIPSAAEGKSIVAQLNDATASVRKAAMHQYPRKGNVMGYSLRTTRYRYVKWIKNDYMKKPGGPGALVGRELYDFEKDPKETTNFAGNPDYKEVVKMFEQYFKERGSAQHTTVVKGCFGIE